MSSIRDEFVTAPRAHGVELYVEVGQLADSVARFLAGAESAVVVATERQLAAIRPLLDPRQTLVIADAAETLDQILEPNGWVSRTSFEQVVGALLDEAGSSPRVFGSMVDVLVGRGEPLAAEALEILWNDLQRRRDFSLLCGYQVDVFDRRAQSELVPAICRAHSHVVPAHDPDRFARAVDRALTDVLGASLASDVRYIVSRSLRGRRVPASQDALRWVAANLPDKADEVLAAARSNYAGT